MFSYGYLHFSYNCRNFCCMLVVHLDRNISPSDPNCSKSARLPINLVNRSLQYTTPTTTTRPPSTALHPPSITSRPPSTTSCPPPTTSCKRSRSKKCTWPSVTTLWHRAKDSARVRMFSSTASGQGSSQIFPSYCRITFACWTGVRLISSGEFGDINKSKMMARIAKLA